MDVDVRRAMPRYSEEIKQQAKELYAQGLNQSEVGRQLGVDQKTVCRWVNPEVAELNRENSRRWKQENPERRREYNRRWHQENPEKSRENSRRWKQENPDRYRERHRRWAQKNSERCREKSAFRRAAEKEATPPWLTKEHRKQMRALHAEARRLEKITGTPHHVDHIIPIHAKFDGRGKQTACGLHVPWNLKVIPGPENCSKQCKLPGPEEWTAV